MFGEQTFAQLRTGVRLVSGRTSVRYRFGSPFSSKRLWFLDTVLWLCPSLTTKTLKWLSSLAILMQKSFWWWQCNDRYIISLSPHLHTPPFSPSLISRTVSVDVKRHVYLLYRNKSQHRKLTLEKKILPPFLQYGKNKTKWWNMEHTYSSSIRFYAWPCLDLTLCPRLQGLYGITVCEMLCVCHGGGGGGGGRTRSFPYSRMSCWAANFMYPLSLEEGWVGWGGVHASMRMFCCCCFLCVCVRARIRFLFAMCVCK